MFDYYKKKKKNKYKCFCIQWLIPLTLLTIACQTNLIQPEATATTTHQEPTPASLEPLTKPGMVQIGKLTPDLCTKSLTTRQSYGCTYFVNISTYKYPFPSDTITIGLEDYMVDDIQQGYLHNVISQEMIEGAPLPAYVAQAIASHSFIYYQIQNTAEPLNNSTQFQAFIPFRFAGLTNTHFAPGKG